MSGTPTSAAANARDRLARDFAEVDHHRFLVELALADDPGDVDDGDVVRLQLGAPFDRLELGQLLTLTLERRDDVLVRRLGGALAEHDAFVLFRLDDRTNFDARRIMERLALVQVRVVDDRLGHRLNVVLVGGGDEALLHQRFDDLLLDLTAEHLLQHRARNLALAEAFERDAARQIFIGLVELLA